MRKRLWERLQDAMTSARNTANGQQIVGYIVLPADAYELLYQTARTAMMTLRDEHEDHD